jgi:aminoglycoside phosphotransferase (APT) family kinase protein
MAESDLDRRLRRLARTLDPPARLIRAWSLGGGISAQMVAFETEQPGGETRALVLRRHGAADRARNPNIAADEFRLLQLLDRAGVPAPRPYCLDQSGEIFPAPYLVLEYVEGSSDVAPEASAAAIEQTAAALAKIHAVDAWRLRSLLPSQKDIAAALLGSVSRARGYASGRCAHPRRAVAGLAAVIS